MQNKTHQMLLYHTHLHHQNSAKVCQCLRDIFTETIVIHIFLLEFNETIALKANKRVWKTINNRSSLEEIFHGILWCAKNQFELEDFFAVTLDFGSLRSGFLLEQKLQQQSRKKVQNFFSERLWNLTFETHVCSSDAVFTAIREQKPYKR